MCKFKSRLMMINHVSTLRRMSQHSGELTIRATYVRTRVLALCVACLRLSCALLRLRSAVRLALLRGRFPSGLYPPLTWVLMPPSPGSMK